MYFRCLWKSLVKHLSGRSNATRKQIKLVFSGTLYHCLTVEKDCLLLPKVGVPEVFKVKLTRKFWSEKNWYLPMRNLKLIPDSNENKSNLFREQLKRSWVPKIFRGLYIIKDHLQNISIIYSYQKEYSQ